MPTTWHRLMELTGTTTQAVRDKAAKVPIQISAAVEHYNRIARMVDAGEIVTMTVDLAGLGRTSDL